MTVRRFLVATAVAVLLCAQTSAASADGVAAYDGGARAPATTAVTSAVTVADITRGTGEPKPATGKRGHHSSKRETGIFSQENQSLNLAGSTKTSSAGSSGGGSILRTIGGLLVVIAAIYAVAWVLRRVKRSREGQASGSGLTSIATLPLGNGRSLHLVRAGSDVILVGSSEQGVGPIHHYTEEEALATGVLAESDAVMRDAAAAFMPDGTPVPPPRPVSRAAGWRPVDTTHASGPPKIVDALRRLTVRQ